MYFNKFEIKTNNTKVENIEKLRKIVYTDKLPTTALNFDYKGKPFVGEITNETFDIMPVIEGRNSFIPVMKGEIIGDNQSTILVRMRLHLFIITFFGIITLFILWTTFKNPNSGGYIVLPILYSIFTFFYLRESKKFKLKFENYFK